MPTTLFDFLYKFNSESAQNEAINAVAKSRVKEFMPSSYFFTEGGLTAQTAISDAYGPVNSSTFRITTRFSLANKKAFAVTSGQVLILPQTGSQNAGKVNVIIKPLKNIDVGIPIKYFIYRGLKKNMFVNGLNILESNDSTNTPFMKKVWTDLKTFNNLVNPLPNVPATLFGYNETEADTITIDQKFFNLHDDTTANVNKNYSLAIIEAGQYFGDFLDNGGFEIVLDDGTYQQEKSDTGFAIDLGFGRSTDVVLNVADIAANPDISERIYRENVQKFLDPAAFYGAHITEEEKGEIKVVSTLDTIKYATRVAIYENIVSKFYNKNKLYLYIQAERGRSYNFDGVLGINALKIGVAGAVGSSPYKTSDWPIIISELQQTHQVEENDSKKVTNNLAFQLKYKTADKRLTVYNSHGNCTNSEVEGSFLPFTALLEEDPATQEYTKEIHYNLINTYNLLSNTSLTVKNIATFIFISSEEKEVEYFNDFFGPINLMPIINPPPALPTKVVKKAVSTKNKTLYLNNEFSVMNQNLFFSGIFSTPTPPDPPVDNRMRLYVLKQVDTTDNSKNEFKFFGTSGYGFYENIEQYNKLIYGNSDYYVWKGKITDLVTSEDIETLQLINFQKEGNVLNYMQLGLTEKEFNKLIYDSETVDPNANHVPSDATNIFFHLDNSGITQGLIYTKYRLGIKYDGLFGIPVTTYPSAANEVFVYSVDGHYFFTKEFSEKHEFNVEFSKDAMVNFRTIPSSYAGEFGFDWLRLGDNTESSYEDSIISGYEDKSFWLGDTEFDTPIEAYEFMRKEYINIITAPFNDEIYYVPYLNIYPQNAMGTPAPPSTVSLLAKIKNHSAIIKYELIYDHQLFTISPINFPLAIGSIGTNSAYAINFNITCLKEFERDQTITVLAYTQEGLELAKGKVAGVIKVCKNSRLANRKQIKIAIVKVRTNVANVPGTEQIGIVNDPVDCPNETSNLSKALYQSYIYGDTDSPITLDLRTDPKFHAGVAGSYIESPDFILPFANGGNLQKYLRQELYRQHGTKYRNYFKIFIFDINTKPGDTGSVIGNVDDIGIHSVNLYKGRNNFTMSHEAMHGFGLLHTHKDLLSRTPDVFSPVTNPNAKYVYHHAYVNLPLATDNMMSYSGNIRKSTWNWQWKIMINNLKNYVNAIEN